LIAETPRQLDGAAATVACAAARRHRQQTGGCAVASERANAR
jgi:hypothetical protein